MLIRTTLVNDFQSSPMQMSAPAEPALFTPAEQAVLHALLYFEIFSYPLTVEEVFRFSRTEQTSPERTIDSLERLVSEGLVYRFGSFYQTKNDASWIGRRLDSNRRADEMMPTARRMARFIGAFPFLRGVFVSGSLSKHCMQPDSDIDFFLITTPGRLWLARTLLVLFKKIFLFNSHKYFCVNYFVDTDHLEIEEKNLFTGTETVTLLPLYGQEWHTAFVAANGWAYDFFPHFPPRQAGNIPGSKPRLLKKSIEWLLGGRFGNWLDQAAMHLTVGFWKRKFRHLDAGTFDVALKSRRYVSKHHPLYFQKKVLDAFAQKTQAWK